MTEYKKTLIKTIIDNYNIRCDANSIHIENLFQYPHIFSMHLPDNDLIIKQISRYKLHCKNIDDLYSSLSTNPYVEIPQMTNNGKYSFIYDDNLILVYKKLFEIKNLPPSIWWSECLSNIHKMNITSNYLHFFSNNFFDDVFTLLSSANKYIDTSLKEKIKYLLNVANDINIDGNINFVVCHNDPYNLNVMQYNNNYKLIDTDGMGLSPKEFDIQKLLYNYVINSDNLDDVFGFWNQFKINYEENYQSIINISLLKKIYILDMLKSISWLYIVSNDYTRLDRIRQEGQLNLFKDSLIKEKHLKFLKKL